MSDHIDVRVSPKGTYRRLDLSRQPDIVVIEERDEFCVCVLNADIPRSRRTDTRLTANDLHPVIVRGYRIRRAIVYDDDSNLCR